MATAIVQLTVADADALATAFAAPGIEEVVGKRQARRPYKMGWANHEPLV